MDRAVREHGYHETTRNAVWPYIGARRLSWACVAPVLWMALVSEHGMGAAGTRSAPLLLRQMGIDGGRPCADITGASGQWPTTRRTWYGSNYDVEPHDFASLCTWAWAILSAGSRLGGLCARRGTSAILGTHEITWGPCRQGLTRGVAQDRHISCCPERGEQGTR